MSLLPAAGTHQHRVRQGESLYSEAESCIRSSYDNTISYPIYLYFKDKAELLESICQETFSKLVQRLTKITEQPGDPIERLKRGLFAYVEFGLENPHHYRATFMTPLPDEFDHEKYVQPESPGIQAFDFLRRCVYDCIAAEKFKTQDAELASQTLWAGVHGITSLLITHTHFPWVGREKVIRGTINAIVAGLEAGHA